MTRDDIIRMAREVGLLPTTLGPTIQTRYAKAKEQALERFFHMAQAAALANTDPSSFMSYQEGYDAGQAAEREACLALHDHEDVLAPVGNSAWGEAYQDGWAEGTAAYWKAIRARGQA